MTEAEQNTKKLSMTLMQRVRKRLSYLFDLDPRSMALYRIVFGSFCMADIWYRLPYLQMMYSSSGWHPNGWVVNHFGIERAHPLSLLHLINTTTSITIFFWGAMFCAFCFTLGIRTRLFQTLTALCMISIHNRNNVLQNGGDIIHNLWWMWTIFLPLGRRWSIDALIASWKVSDKTEQDLNRKRQRDTRPYTSLVAFAVILNLSLCYFLNGVHKNGETWLNGDAVALTLEQDRILTSLGAFVRAYIPLWCLKLLTWSTLVVEACAPLFLLSPYKSVWARRIILLVLGSFHIGVGLTLHLGFFSLWMLVIYLLILRAEDMDALARWFKPSAQPLKVYYDSDCGVCHAFARLVARLDAYHLITWVGRSTPQHLPGGLSESEFQELRELSLIVHLLESDEKTLTHHRAVAEILKRLPLMRVFAYILLFMGPLAYWGYSTFSRHRHRVSAWLGYGLCGIKAPQKSTEAHDSSEVFKQHTAYWTLDSDSGLKRFRRRFVRGLGELYVVIALIAALSTVMYSNRFFRTMKKPAYPQWARSFVTYGQFYQNWRLFSPEAPYQDGWMVLEAKLSDGRVVDIRTGKAPNFDVPNYKNRTWGFYEGRWGFKLRREAHTLWPLFVNWMKRPVQRLRLSPKDRVEELNFYWVADQTQKPIASGQRPPIPKGKTLVRSWSRVAEKALKQN